MVVSWNRIVFGSSNLYRRLRSSKICRYSQGRSNQTFIMVSEQVSDIRIRARFVQKILSLLSSKLSTYAGRDAGTGSSHRQTPQNKKDANPHRNFSPPIQRSCQSDLRDGVAFFSHYFGMDNLHRKKSEKDGSTQMERCVCGSIRSVSYNHAGLPATCCSTPGGKRSNGLGNI